MPASASGRVWNASMNGRDVMNVSARSVSQIGGTRPATLRDVSITPVRMHTGLDILFGNLGQDFIDSFERVTFNFSAMTFTVGVPRARP